MDAFEELMADLLWQKGYWVQNSFKIALTKAEKRRIKRPTSPRWEIDIAAYSGRDNVLRLFECKSYLNSAGVRIGDFSGPKKGDRFKLFNEPLLRQVVFSRLKKQAEESGLCPRNVKIKLCLACAKVAGKNNLEEIQAHFRSKRWELWDPNVIKKELVSLSTTGYENRVAAIAAKILSQ